MKDFSTLQEEFESSIELFCFSKNKEQFHTFKEIHLGLNVNIAMVFYLMISKSECLAYINSHLDIIMFSFVFLI